MDANELAGRIDHTILRPEAVWGDVERVVGEAIEHRFASVCVAPCFVRAVAQRLGGRGLRTTAVVGFPHGTSKPTIKAIEATSCVKDGADEIDVVAGLANLLEDRFDAMKAEFLEIARAARAVRADVIIKVIVESAALGLNELSDVDAEKKIALACRAVIESGCDFIKTSTGFHPAGGASEQVVRWMKRHAGGAIFVKASGGIRDLATAQRMIDAGADRLGCSQSVLIMRQSRDRSVDRKSTPIKEW